MDNNHEICTHLQAEERALWQEQHASAVQRAAILATRLSVAESEKAALQDELDALKTEKGRGTE